MITISGRLKKLRKKKGVSLQIAANDLGITKPHLWQLEIGKSDNPTLKTLLSLSKYYDITVAQLIGEK